jgi:hypothetical protein
MSWARVADDSIEGDVVRSWDQSLALTLGASWQASRWNASVFGGWHRGWPRTPFTLSPLSLGERNAARWGDFYTLDLRGSYVWPQKYGDFSWSSKSPTPPTVPTNAAPCCKRHPTEASGPRPTAGFRPS